MKTRFQLWLAQLRLKILSAVISRHIRRISHLQQDLLRLLDLQRDLRIQESTLHCQRIGLLTEENANV